MNTVWIVLPILTLLMFELGLTLEPKDFLLFRYRPLPVWAGLAGQLIMLPALAFALGVCFHLEPVFFMGLMLIACSPGGSSSNVFTMLVKGDVALSVSLTALSSVFTLFTIPSIMQFVLTYVGEAGSGWEVARLATPLAPEAVVSLPAGPLIVQNIVSMLLPIAAGVLLRYRLPSAAARMERYLSRMAFPALILLATLFFVQHRVTIAAHFTRLGGCIVCLILLAMGAGAVAARLLSLGGRVRRTLVIELGMQNAAQAIALAGSPFVFNNETMAIPAILYALMMNVLLLLYVGIVKRRVAA